MALSATSMVVATAGIVTLGRWTRDEPLSARVVVGGGALALGLALLGEANGELGRRVAAIVLLSAAFMYVPSIAYTAGLTNQKPPDWGWGKDEPRTLKRHSTAPRKPGAGGTARGRAV